MEVVVRAKTMESIGEAAFRGCTELKSMTIPEGVTEIPDSAFERCRKMKTLKMPRKGVLRIGSKAFAECAALMEMTLNPELESIGEEAFLRCGLTVAQVPDTVTFIGKKAFYLSGLTRLKLPAVLEEIPEYLCAFSKKLTKVTFPKEVKKISEGAFMQCPVGAVTLPEGLLTIEQKAFAFDKEVARKRNGRGKTMAKLKGLSFPASLQSIGQDAFAANDALFSVAFAKDSRLEEIGEEAFALCFSLKSVTLPDSMRKLGKGAFRRCLKMTKASLGSGLTEIGDNAFEYCLKLTSLTVPASLTTFGTDVLKYHGRKLTVTCPEGSAMEQYLRDNDPGVKIVFPKK